MVEPQLARDPACEIGARAATAIVRRSAISSLHLATPNRTTMESHLAQVYRRLAIPGRDELKAALTEDDQRTGPQPPPVS